MVTCHLKTVFASWQSDRLFLSHFESGSKPLYFFSWVSVIHSCRLSRPHCAFLGCFTPIARSEPRVSTNGNDTSDTGDWPQH
jgi:hypothetical protein